MARVRTERPAFVPLVCQCADCRANLARVNDLTITMRCPNGHLSKFSLSELCEVRGRMAGVGQQMKIVLR